MSGNNLWVNVEDLGSWAKSDYAFDACKAASFILWGMSGRKFTGVTTTTERYVSLSDPYLRGASVHTYWPTLINGSVVNSSVGSPGEDVMTDGSSSRTRVRLRGSKVLRVHTIRDTFGNVIDPTTYYLADHSTVYAASGWPTSSIEVTYTFGSPPPAAGKAAARALATELVRDYEGDEDCALPNRLTSVTRQGMTYTILDRQDFIEDMRTGIYSIDLFLKAVNPDKARARARIYSPDKPRARKIAPKGTAMPLSSYDLYVAPSGGATLYYLDDISARFILSDPAWVISVDLSDWSNSSTTTLSGAAVLDNTAMTIRVAASYAAVLAAIGPRNPGILDIFATRPSLSNPLIDEVVNIVTSNVILQLDERLTPIFTA